MAQYSKKERLMASLLSATPGLKVQIKKFYIALNYFIHKKKYRFLVLNLNRSIELIEPNNKEDETYFGYYDKSPENENGLILYNETVKSTSQKPGVEKPIWLNVLSRETGIKITVAESFSYNWQQGCRAQWLTDDSLIYNFFDGEHRSYKAALYNVKTNSVIRVFENPVQDSHGEEFFLSINYRRIMSLRPDYGYRNISALKKAEMSNLMEDGIWRVEIATGCSSLIVSLEDVVKTSPSGSFINSVHKVNHVMISPDGRSFIFIHRWYQHGRRFDRLMLYEEGGLRVLVDESMVSHMCWINPRILFGYLRYKSIDGFYFINLTTGLISPCEDLNLLNNGDGHPSCFKDWLVIDSYPDKSRMQHLTLYNYQTRKIIPLLELFHPLKYQGECRCDLHPRFSPDGKRIYFDTVFAGKRRLGSIDVSSITL